MTLMVVNAPSVIASLSCFQVEQVRAQITRYIDSTNQRTRVDDFKNQFHVVDDFKTHRSMQVNISSTGELTCDSYCPIDLNDTVIGFHLPHQAKDAGKATVDGQPAEAYVAHVKASDLQQYIRRCEVYRALDT